MVQDSTIEIVVVREQLPDARRKSTITSSLADQGAVNSAAYEA
jgi:hypothetical protein